MPHEAAERLLHLLREVQRLAPAIRDHSGGWFPTHLSPVLERVRNTVRDPAAGWIEIELLAPDLADALGGRDQVQRQLRTAPAAGAVVRMTRKAGESETAWLNRVKNEIESKVQDADKALANKSEPVRPAPAAEAGK
ncbi:MAG TPA: hypothetical protein VD866_00915 [Urbifossiella sp.]|nr:hypothetical protein [Urbifossiella sp.]